MTADVTLALLSCGSLMQSEEKRNIVKAVAERSVQPSSA